VPARIATAVLAALVPALLAFRSGGYFPSERGLVLLVFVLVGLVCVVGGERVAAGRAELLAVASLGSLAVWSAVSAAWAPGPDGAVFAAELVLVYAGALGACALALARERVAWLLGGLLAGTGAVALWALETRLVQGDLGTAGDLLSGTRLVRPIGYANALGALCALGLLLGLGLAVSEAPRWARAAAAAALVPLAAALYFTLSRGSDLALLAGLGVLAVRERRRIVLGALLLVLPGLGVLLAARSPLTEIGLTRGDARAAGHRLALELAVLAVGTTAVALRARPLAERIARHGRMLAVAGAVLVVVALVAALASGVATRAVHRLESPPPATGGDLNGRVLSVSGNGRTAYWRVARGMVAREPLLGAGAGSYERWWLEERPTPNAARNAHDLYLETLAELGPLGLALLLLALGVPLWAARRARGILSSAALAAYVAWLVHALLDWDWQIPAVTLPALGCGAAVLVLARDGTERALTPRLRAALVVPLAALLLAALAMHVGNRAAAAAAQAVATGDDAAALAAAHRARRWMPWAAQPLQVAGEAELASHRDAAARADLRRALARNDEDWSVWYDLASVTTGAAHREALRRARALDPLAPELAHAG
jgi:hypothetical protein